MSVVAALKSDTHHAFVTDCIIKTGPSPDNGDCRIMAKHEDDGANFFTIVGDGLILDAVNYLQNWAEFKKHTIDFKSVDFIDALTQCANHLMRSHANIGTPLEKSSTKLYVMDATDFIRWDIQFSQKSGAFSFRSDIPVVLTPGRIEMNYGGTLTWENPPSSQRTAAEIFDHLKSRILETHETMRGQQGFLDYEFQGFFSGVAISQQAPDMIATLSPFSNLEDLISASHGGAKNLQELRDTKPKWDPF